MALLNAIILICLALSDVAGARALGSKAHSLLRHEHLANLPIGWLPTDAVDTDEPLILRLLLTHGTKSYLKVAEEVSDPLSGRFGQHLSADELQSILPDHTRAREIVGQWLSLKSVAIVAQGHDWVEIETTAGQAGDLLNTEFSLFTHDDGSSVVRTTEYSLPEAVAEHVDFVFPTIHFPTATRRVSSRVGRRQHIPTGPATCSDNTCPALLQKKYNINYRPQDAQSGSKLGVTGFLENFPNVTDVRNFLLRYGVHNDTKTPQYSVKLVNKGVSTVQSGALTVEPNLDLDYSMAFTGPLPVTFYSVGGRGTQLSQPGNKTLPSKQSQNEPYLDFLQSLLAEKDPPQVISMSYSDDEQSVPEKYARRVCDLFAQAAARGISVIGSSGDGGASGTGGNTQCIGPDGRRRFIPTFPSSCPWITSVGATASYGGVASFSSGGFSNYFDTPSWQSNVVQKYIKSLNGSHKGLYNPKGRGVPDVSLLGDDYLILSAGFASAHDGTSASTPVFASMIALINDLRLRAGKPVLGFLNPLLYAAKARSAYRDVADGSNSIGCADGNFFETGWEALAGWDAGTGLGEPDFERLRKALY